MKCNTPIDPETKCALIGDELAKALKDPDSPRCEQELSDDNVFCPSCGGRAESIYFNHRRAPRRRFWASLIFLILTNVVCVFAPILGVLSALAYGYFIKTSVRRLHDIGRSGWLACVLIASTLTSTVILVVGSEGHGMDSICTDILNVVAAMVTFAMVGWLGFARGTQGPNKYGPE